jgi:tetratricopeptide (TPR) repeat protein
MGENFRAEESNEERLLACAARVAQTVENLDGYSELVSLIAVRYAESGLLDTAVELAETVADPYARDQLFASIAAACVEFGENDYADELLEMIEEPALYSMAVEQNAVKYAEVGEFDKALQIAREMNDSGHTLSRIALIYSDAEQSAEALELVRSIEDPTLKANALTELAARSLRAGGKAESAELLSEATEAAHEIEFAQERINILVEISSLYHEGGQDEQAFATLSRASELGEDVDGAIDEATGQDVAKDETLSTLAASFARLQHYAQAEPLIEKIEDPFQFSAAAAAVALEYHKAGQSAQALTLLKEALEVAREEEVYGEHGLTRRENLLAGLAVSYSAIGHYEEALKITGEISSLNLRHGALKEVAKTGLRTGHYDVVFQVAEMGQEPYAKVLYNIEISDALVEAGQTALADRALSQAMEIAETLERAFEKALALMELALRYAQRERTARAAELLSQALETTALIGDDYHKSRALISLDDRYRKAELAPGEKELKILQQIDSQIETQD